MPSIASFPDKDIDNTSIAQTSTAAASSGVQRQPDKNSDEHASMSGMMEIMRQFMREQNNEVKKLIETPIAQHIQFLNGANAQEMVQRQ